MATDQIGQGLLSNPLFGMGIGLMTGNSPGGSFGGGAQQGLQNMMLMHGQNQRNQMQDLQTKRLAALMAEEEQQQTIQEAMRAAGNPAWIGNAPQPAESAPYMQSGAEMFPGEQPMGGLMSQTPAQPATGMYAQNEQLGGLMSDMYQADPMATQQMMARSYFDQMAQKPIQDPGNIRTYDNLISRGMKPPEAQKLAFGGGGTNINIGSDGSGVWTDEQKLEANIPVGDVVVEGKSGPKILKAGEKKADEYEKLDRVDSSINAYRDMLDKVGTEYLPTEGKLAIGGLHKDLLLELKELYNLGVLSGPDLDIMEQVIMDPTAMTSQVYSGGDLLGQLDATVIPKMKAARERLDERYGKTEDKKEESVSTDGWTVKRIK